MSFPFAEPIPTEDGSLTMRHPDYEEDFHSRKGANFEARNLYMLASGFCDALERGTDGPWSVLDVGLGLGYNALMTIDAWWRSPGLVSLDLHSLEHTAELVFQLMSADCRWKKGWSSLWCSWVEGLCPGESHDYELRLRHPHSGQHLLWRIRIGDARSAPLEDHQLRFIWQDAFSPKKNPELWTPNWFAKLHAASRQDVCLVTYSVARVVKDALSHAGWEYEKFLAPDGNKQWLRAHHGAQPLFSS